MKNNQYFYLKNFEASVNKKTNYYNNIVRDFLIF